VKPSSTDIISETFINLTLSEKPLSTWHYQRSLHKPDIISEAFITLKNIISEAFIN
jgi:hypothetical protein